MSMANSALRFRYAAAAVLLAYGAFGAPQAFAADTPTMAQFQALEARTQKLEDEEQIRQLLVEYGHLLDTHDLQGYANLFAKDGEWIGGFGKAKGPDGILALMEKFMGKGTGGFDVSKVRGFHLLTNMIVHVDGDHATALSKLVFMARNPDNKPVPVMGGHYDDTLVRENGQWKFLRRYVMMDIPYQDPRTITAPKPAPAQP